MSWRPPGTLRVLRLLALTSLRRQLRAMAVLRSKRAAARHGRRTATARKPGSGLAVLMAVMLPLFLLQSLMLTNGAVRQLAAATRGVSGPDESAAGRAAPPAWRDSGTEVLLAEPEVWPDRAPAEVFRAGGVLLLVALALALLASSVGTGNVDLGRGDWQLPWLLTFPVPTRAVVLAKLGEYALVQFFPWFTLFPLQLQLLRVLAVPRPLLLALLGTALIAILNAALRLWLETWLRMRLSLQRLRGVQGLCALIGLALIGFVFDICLGGEVPRWFVAAAGAMPAWSAWLPPAWPLAVGRDGGAALLPTLVLVLLALPLCVSAVVRLLVHGAMRSAGVDPGRRTAAAQWAHVHRLHGVIGKDLRLLLRDRSFLVQTVGVPVFMVALNLLVNRGSLAVSGSVPALLAYGIGSYAVVFGCFQVLGGEGRALWVLYTLPVTVAAVLRSKVRLWASLGLVFALASLAVFAAARGVGRPMLLLSDLVFVSAGVWAASHLAAAIGILGTDPASDHVPRRPGARYAYLYLFFAATYAIGLRGDDLAGRLVALLVFGTLAFAFWQLACDRLPWLLDPVAKGSASLALADGAAALVVFTIVQGLVLVLVSRAGLQPLLPSAIAFTVAGGLTTVLFGVILTLRGIHLPTALGLQPDGHAARSLLLGAVAGSALGGAGLGYLRAMRALHWFEIPEPGSGPLPLVLLACLAAPLFEELIFRGLLFQGLTRSVPLRLALPWSAMLFAVVHPALSWLPVFGLGLATAWVFHRTRFLPAAMVVHAVYNAVVLLVPM